MNERFRHDGIIILGAPRSGTTLVRRLLDAHPNLACPPETNLLNGCAKFLSEESIQEGVDIGVLSGLGYLGFEESEVLRRLREFAFTFHREHAKRSGKARWVEKTAFDSFYIDQIDRLCGEHAYFVGIVRHGLDVTCSLQELCTQNGRYLPEVHAYIKRYPAPLEAFAHIWVDLITSMLAFIQRHPENAMLLRYEDLVDDAPTSLRRILEFVGEDWSPTIIENALSNRENVGLGDWKTYAKSTIDHESVGRWKTLSKETVNTLAHIVNPTLSSLGYDPVRTQTPREAADARRRYELGLLVGAMKKRDE